MIQNFTNEGELKVNIWPYAKPGTMIRASNSSSPSISSGAVNTLPYTDVTIDTLGEYDSGTYTFTPIESGYYNISAGWLLVASSAWQDSEYFILYFLINGSTEIRPDLTNGRSTGYTSHAHVQGSATLWLNAGDNLTVAVYQSSGSSITAQNDAAYNYLIINRVWTEAVVVEGLGSVDAIGSYVGDGTAGSVTFSGIPGIYRHLWVSGSARSTTVTTGEWLWWRANGDTGANYEYNGHYASATTWSNTSSWAGTTASICWISAASAPSNIYSPFQLQVMSYTKGVYKPYIGRGTGRWATTTNYAYNAMLAGSWMSISPITSLTIGITGNFATNSQFALYGLR